MGLLAENYVPVVWPYLLIFALSFVLVAAAIAAAIVIVWRGLFRRAEHLLEKWARENELTIVKAARHVIVMNPVLCLWQGMAVLYRVRVSNRQGGVLSGWVRCGSWLLGPFSDQVAVRWD